VLDVLDFDQRLERADAVVVGEGRLDRQSLKGKIVGNILDRALAAGKPCHAIVGSLSPDGDEARRAGFASVRTASSPEEIETAAAELGVEA
jgi:glycerate kinase